MQEREIGAPLDRYREVLRDEMLADEEFNLKDSVAVIDLDFYLAGIGYDAGVGGMPFRARRRAPTV